MNSREFRRLHWLSGSKEPYGFWLQEQQRLFRLLFGLHYAPNSPEEEEALRQWLAAQGSAAFNQFW